MAGLGTYLRTLRHLTPGQLGWRLWHEARLRARRAAPGPAGLLWPVDLSARVALELPAPPPPALLGAERALADRWREGTVAYLGVEGPAGDWTAAGKPRLWRYHRHYHAELVALAALSAAEPGGGWRAAAEALFTAWWREAPLPRGDGWEPYPVARRTLAFALAAALEPALGPRLAPLLALQLRFLRGNLERHLLGNHLLCDAAALVAGSAVLEAHGAEALGQEGQRLLAEELRRQVLPDGGYAERTAQYHAIVLQDVLLALGLWRRRGRRADPGIPQAATRMLAWLAAVRRGPGAPWLNDAAPDATPAPGEVLALGAALGLRPSAEDGWLARCFGGAPDAAEPGDGPRDLELPDTGWTLLREGSHELLFEHGPIGPPEQPGHGHADALSFELTWDGAPLVTDTGVTSYEAGPVRDHERSARAHACATVDGEGADELWAAFRVGARGRASGGPARRGPDGLRSVAGEVRAPAGWRHRRTLLFWPGRALVGLDQVDGARGEVRLHLPLDPAAEPSAAGLRGGGLELALEILRGRRLADDRTGWVGRGFGRRQPRATLQLALDASGRLAWALRRPGVEVTLAGGACVLADGAARASAPLPEGWAP